MEVYDACPYCLAEITIGKEKPIAKEKPKSRKKKTVSVEEKEPILKQEKPHPAPEKQGCPHYFGYLAERSKKGKIPEECMMCEKIVQCMLKKVTE